MKDVVDALRGGGGEGLPIGWSLLPAAKTPAAAAAAGTAPAAATTNGWWWHIPGWVVTAFAVSLGAPFWFQLLNKFVNLRNSGAKPDSADGSAAN